MKLSLLRHYLSLHFISITAYQFLPCARENPTAAPGARFNDESRYIIKRQKENGRGQRAREQSEPRLFAIKFESGTSPMIRRERVTAGSRPHE